MQNDIKPIVQEEIDFIQEIFGDFLASHDFVLEEGNETQISYKNRTFRMDFVFDFRYGRMGFGGIYLVIRATNGRFHLKDIFEHLYPKKGGFGKVFTNIKSEGNLIDQRVYNKILEDYFDLPIDSGDTSWEPSLERSLKKKYPY